MSDETSALHKALPSLSINVKASPWLEIPRPDTEPVLSRDADSLITLTHFSITSSVSSSVQSENCHVFQYDITDKKGIRG